MVPRRWWGSRGRRGPARRPPAEHPRCVARWCECRGLRRCGAGCSELFDQRPERGTVLTFEVSLQAQAPVAAVPEPQCPSGRGRLRLVAGLRAVRVEVRENVLADPVQGDGVERPGMASQLSLRGLAVVGAHAGGDRVHRLSQALFMHHVMACMDVARTATPRAEAGGEALAPAEAHASPPFPVTAPHLTCGKATERGRPAPRPRKQPLFSASGGVPVPASRSVTRRAPTPDRPRRVRWLPVNGRWSQVETDHRDGPAVSSDVIYLQEVPSS